MVALGNVFHDVFGVENRFGVICYQIVIYLLGMSRRNNYRVVFFYDLRRNAGNAVISFSVITVRAYIRVEVVDRATLCIHQLAYGKRGAFTLVVDIVFISHAALQYLSSVKRFFMLIKQISQTAYGVFGHFVVNHHRRLYHRSMETVLTRLP